MPITVAIVEDLDDIREGLAFLINGSEGFRCVATYASAEAALEQLPDLAPDVVLMDIGLPGMSGIECIQRLKAQDATMQIMMLTIYEDDEKIYSSLAAGATGYVLKKTPPAKLWWRRFSMRRHSLRPPLLSPSASWKFSPIWPKAIFTRKLPPRFRSASKPCAPTCTKSTKSCTSTPALKRC
jgi:DNA-binding response OmpR family regulator